MVEQLKDTIMRRNKTYEQQKKYYDGSNDYESLGAIFMYWLECGNETAKQMQETYRECNRECKTFSTFVTSKRSTSSLGSSTLARSKIGSGQRIEEHITFKP